MRDVIMPEQEAEIDAKVEAFLEEAQETAATEVEEEIAAMHQDVFLEVLEDLDVQAVVGSRLSEERAERLEEAYREVRERAAALRRDLEAEALLHGGDEQ